MKVCVVMDNGFEELEAMGPIALLRRAGIDVDLVCIEGHEVTGRFGVTYSPAIPFDSYDFDQADCLVLPGGPHWQKIEKNEKVCEQLKAFAADKVLAAICAAPTILGKLGLLKGKNYTCFQSMNEDFGGTYQYAYTVTDGNLITELRQLPALNLRLRLLKSCWDRKKQRK